MKLKKSLAAFLIGAMLLTACSTKTTTKDKKSETKTEEKTEKKQIKFGMVTDVGGVNDQSFNQSAFEGLKELEKEGIAKISYVESTQQSDYKTNIETSIDAGNDLIACIGYALADDMLSSAQKNSDQKYVIIDHSYGDKTPKNVVGTIFADHENSFLIGYLAGTLTKSNKVGFIGGADSPLIKKFEAGFREGVKFAEKDSNKKVEVLCQYADSFTDATKGKAIANSMYTTGADMIFHAAGGVGTGVIESAKENKKFVFGVDRDQSYLAPENVIASTIKKVNSAIKSVGEALSKGNFKGGSTIEFSFKTNGVDIAYGKEDKLKIKISDDLKQKIEQLKKEIASGKIVVPTEVK